MEAELARLRADMNALHDTPAPRLDWLGVRMDAIAEGEARLVQTVDELKRLVQIEAVSRWIRHATLVREPLVSVVLATCSRPRLLRRAIDSVVAQRYENWELVVVEDGDDEASRAAVQEIGDPRVSWSAIPKGGVAPARNAALEAAGGEIIAYLDDDNVMDPEWLYAVAWGFEQRPEADVLYGAFVIDDYLRVTGQDSGALPRTFLHPFSREALRGANVADIGAIAHRAKIADAWFDPALTGFEDWDLLLRLTAEKDPLVLPAIACYYTTDAPCRLTTSVDRQANDAIISERIAELLGR